MDDHVYHMDERREPLERLEKTVSEAGVLGR